MRKVSAQLLYLLLWMHLIIRWCASINSSWIKELQKMHETLGNPLCKGVLSKPMKNLIFMNCPPPLPPGAAVLIDLKTSEIIWQVSPLIQLILLYLRMFIIKSKEESMASESLAPGYASFSN